MPLTDLFRALPALILVGILPGLGVASLIAPRWRWWERLAAAPGLSAGLAGVIGLLEHDLHIRFTAATVLPIEALVVIAAVWRVRRIAARPVPAGAPAPVGRGARVVVAAALAAGAVSAGLLAAGYRGIPVPVATDGPVHAAVAAGIAQQHDILPVLPDPSSGSWVRPRAAVEAEAALASEIGGPSAADDLLPLTLLAVLLLPLGLAALALEATGSVAIAALAPLLAIGWAFPSVAVSFGEFPYVVDATMVAPLVIAAVRALRPGELRRHAVLVAALVASMWVVHGLEVITAVLIAAPFCAVRVWPRWRQSGRWLAGMAGAAAIGAALVTVLTRVPLIATTAPAIQGATVTEVSRYGADIGRAGILDSLNAFAHYAFPTGWLMGLVVLGVVAALVERRLRWALVAGGILLACFLDVESTGVLRKVWIHVYPWAVQDRLPEIQYWIAPLIAALGLVWIARRFGLAVEGGRGRAAALVVGAMALVTVAIDAPHDATIYSASITQRGVVTAADVSVIDRLSSRLPAGSVVLTDGIDDSGQWLGALSRDVPYYSSDYIKDHPDDPRLVALEGACSDPAKAAELLQGVTAVFVGARDITEPAHPWAESCIASIPGLELVATAGSDGRTAAAFIVTHSATPAARNG